MIARSCFLFLLLVASARLIARDGDFPVFKIPAKLLHHANAVLRLEELQVEIEDLSRVIKTNHYAITILNEKGEGWAQMTEFYDQFNEILSIEGSLYDAMGQTIRELKNRDIQDLSAVSDNNLIDDSRKKVHNFFCKTYPYTIEYTIVTRQRYSLFFPAWLPQGNSLLSVEKSWFRVTVPIGYPLRYRASRYPSQPEISSTNKTTTLFWQVTNLEAITKMADSPSWLELTPNVLLAPAGFEVNNYQGKMDSWNALGQFVYSLKENRHQLPDPIRQKVHELTDGLKSKTQKIERLYDYLQKNTRYISIQLGLGGWQPFDATYVANKGYGDCKALTNYMYSLLKEAGIESVYALIRAGDEAPEILADFPSQQFNHVILCIPDAKDTTWLECTSQTLPAGYLSSFTSNRYALLAESTGGKLVRTPAISASGNLQQRNSTATLTENGSLLLQRSGHYWNEKQDHLFRLINQLNREKLREVIEEQLNYATYTLKDVSFEVQKSSQPVLHENLLLDVANYASISGKRIFVQPNVATRMSNNWSYDSTRKVDYWMRETFTEIDTVRISIPEGYLPESVPANISESTAFGSYSTQLTIDGNHILFIRKFQQNAGRFPVTDGPRIAAFYQKVFKSDRAKLVLVHKE